MTADSPAAVFVWEVGRARGQSTRRLQWRERRMTRGRHLDRRAVARWAAVRNVLRERGVEVPDN